MAEFFIFTGLALFIAYKVYEKTTNDVSGKPEVSDYIKTLFKMAFSLFAEGKGWSNSSNNNTKSSVNSQKFSTVVTSDKKMCGTCVHWTGSRDLKHHSLTINEKIAGCNVAISKNLERSFSQQICNAKHTEDHYQSIGNRR